MRVRHAIEHHPVIRHLKPFRSTRALALLETFVATPRVTPEDRAHHDTARPKFARVGRPDPS
jgi:hypothetical protein